MPVPVLNNRPSTPESDNFESPSILFELGYQTMGILSTRLYATQSELPNFRSKMLLLPAFATIILALLSSVSGHGRLMDPPARNSMWRLGFPNPVNYNDNELYCGGRVTQWARNKGKCGVCGDPHHQSKKEHEVGGKYANGIISRKYLQGDVIDVTVHITANHKGYFEFRICPVEDQTVEVNQECLDKHLMKMSNGEGSRYYLPEGKSNQFFNVSLGLPADLTCNQCVIQWKYRTGNTWDKDDSGAFCVGCGPQEEFYNCADVSINSRDGEVNGRGTELAKTGTQNGGGKKAGSDDVSHTNEDMVFTNKKDGSENIVRERMSNYGKQKAKFIQKLESKKYSFWSEPDALITKPNQKSPFVHHARKGDLVSKAQTSSSVRLGFNPDDISYHSSAVNMESLPKGPSGVAYRWKAGKSDSSDLEQISRRFGFSSGRSRGKEGYKHKVVGYQEKKIQEFTTGSTRHTTERPLESDGQQVYRQLSRKEKTRSNVGLSVAPRLPASVHPTVVSVSTSTVEKPAASTKLPDNIQNMLNDRKKDPRQQESFLRRWKLLRLKHIAAIKALRASKEGSDVHAKHQGMLHTNQYITDLAKGTSSEHDRSNGRPLSLFTPLPEGSAGHTSKKGYSHFRSSATLASTKSPTRKTQGTRKKYLKKRLPSWLVTALKLTHKGDGGDINYRQNTEKTISKTDVSATEVLSRDERIGQKHAQSTLTPNVFGLDSLESHDERIGQKHAQSTLTPNVFGLDSLESHDERIGQKHAQSTLTPNVFGLDSLESRDERIGQKHAQSTLTPNVFGLDSLESHDERIGQKHAQSTLTPNVFGLDSLESHDERIGQKHAQSTLTPNVFGLDSLESHDERIGQKHAQSTLTPNVFGLDSLESHDERIGQKHAQSTLTPNVFGLDSLESHDERIGQKHAQSTLTPNVFGLDSLESHDERIGQKHAQSTLTPNVFGLDSLESHDERIGQKHAQSTLTPNVFGLDSLESHDERIGQKHAQSTLTPNVFGLDSLESHDERIEQKHAQSTLTPNVFGLDSLESHDERIEQKHAQSTLTPNVFGLDSLESHDERIGQKHAQSTLTPNVFGLDSLESRISDDSNHNTLLLETPQHNTVADYGKDQRSYYDHTLKETTSTYNEKPTNPAMKVTNEDGKVEVLPKSNSDSNIKDTDSLVRYIVTLLLSRKKNEMLNKYIGIDTANQTTSRDISKGKAASTLYNEKDSIPVGHTWFAPDLVKTSNIGRTIIDNTGYVNERPEPPMYTAATIRDDDHEYSQHQKRVQAPSIRAEANPFSNVILGSNFELTTNNVGNNPAGQKTIPSHSTYVPNIQRNSQQYSINQDNVNTKEYTSYETTRGNKPVYDKQSDEQKPQWMQNQAKISPIINNNPHHLWSLRAMKRQSHYQTQQEPARSQLVCESLVALAGGMDRWCTDNCNANFCPPSICKCTTKAANAISSFPGLLSYSVTHPGVHPKQYNQAVKSGTSVRDTRMHQSLTNSATNADIRQTDSRTHSQLSSKNNGRSYIKPHISSYTQVPKTKDQFLRTFKRRTVKNNMDILPAFRSSVTQGPIRTAQSNTIGGLTNSESYSTWQPANRNGHQLNSYPFTYSGIGQNGVGSHSRSYHNNGKRYYSLSSKHNGISNIINKYHHIQKPLNSLS